MIDVVYPLGRGSTWADEELRYSLRSLAMYVQGIRHVYVIGQRPRWLTNAFHIPHPDPYPCKERNIAGKILRACKESGLSQRFLFANDDHYALGPCTAQEIPNWRGGKMIDLARRLPQASHYKQALLNTIEVLEAKNFSTWNFDLHLPIVMDKEFFPLVMACYNWERPRGYVVKSLYANTLQVPHVGHVDLKIGDRLPIPELVRLLKPRTWWSLGPSALNHNLKNLLDALYPLPSPWEIT